MNVHDGSWRFRTDRVNFMLSSYLCLLYSTAGCYTCVFNFLGCDIADYTVMYGVLDCMVYSAVLWSSLLYGVVCSIRLYFVFYWGVCWCVLWRSVGVTSPWTPALTVPVKQTGFQGSKNNNQARVIIWFSTMTTTTFALFTFPEMTLCKICWFIKAMI